jgi:predicted MFS family arabinose efflux permease
MHRVKNGYLALAASNQLAASYYFNYLFFHLRDRYGFSDRDNLAVATLYGALYMVTAWQGGKFAERRGPQTSLAYGFAGLAVSMIAGRFATSVPVEVGVLVFYTAVLTLTWPALEAIAIQHEPPSRVPHAVGVYNCTWSAAAALSYFTGGALYERFGAEAVFTISAVMFVGQLAVLAWLGRLARTATPEPISAADLQAHLDARASTSSAPPKTFLQLAWLANPLSYVAINTLIAVMPGLAHTLGLSPAQTGLFCSVWFFARLAAFAGLWQWTGWHYRFRWLAGGFVVLVASFVSILVIPSLAAVITAQIVFGLACGLMYYSSLFYSMDVGEAKAEHGGLHEAAIGAGIFAGPAVGTLSLSLFPTWHDADAVAVAGLLSVGGAAMVVIWRRGRRRN